MSVKYLSHLSHLSPTVEDFRCSSPAPQIGELVLRSSIFNLQPFLVFNFKRPYILTTIHDIWLHITPYLNSLP